MSLRNFENWMWAEACDMLDQADRLHRHLFRPALMNARQATWEPPVDIYESAIDFKILIALPGVDAEHLKIMLKENLLIIAGHRYLPVSADAHIRRLEIPYGRFERHIELPSAGFEIQASEFLHGCLFISLRKI